MFVKIPLIQNRSNIHQNVQQYNYTFILRLSRYSESAK